MSSWEWTPLESIGPIVFGRNVDDYAAILGLSLKKHESDGIDTWDYYQTGDIDVEIVASHGRVQWVYCGESCLYHGHNLVGAEIDDVIRLFPNETAEIVDLEVGVEYGFEKLGLSLFVVDGHVESATVCGK